MNILPTRNHVVLSAPEEVKTTASGIVLPEGVSERKTAIGEVITVGPDVKNLIDGDKVLYNEYGFDEVIIEGKKYLIGEDTSITATLDED